MEIRHTYLSLSVGNSLWKEMATKPHSEYRPASLILQASDSFEFEDSIE